MKKSYKLQVISEKLRPAHLKMRSIVKPQISPSPLSPPVKGGEILQPSPLAGEGKGEGGYL
ncbi:MAG: hypothetical protein A2X59_09685 [Nitrospirae bacterium GWC2_42_7]|nr:MAG: hypothetical protein A2X59_09685 [Nitrospirae bacterium GWC2_42_7]